MAEQDRTELAQTLHRNCQFGNEHIIRLRSMTDPNETIEGVCPECLRAADAIVASDVLAQRDRRVAAKESREAAEESIDIAFGSNEDVRDWLRERADRIENETKETE